MLVVKVGDRLAARAVEQTEDELLIATSFLTCCTMSSDILESLCIPHDSLCGMEEKEVLQQ